MLELTKTQTTAGLTELRLVVPRDKADLIADALRSLFLFSGQEMQIKEEAEDEKLYPVSDLFPTITPTMCLRGLRTREGLTQAELAERLGVNQHHISEMENGKRPIGAEMAHRLEEAFGTSYKAFL